LTDEVARPSAIRVIAHRGASADRPENTIAAFDEALRQGCSAFELDLQLSRDGVPVVFHDRTLSKADRSRMRIADLPLARLRELDVGGWFGEDYRGERIPTLEEVLERYVRRARLLLEIKVREGETHGPELARAVAETIERSSSGGQTMVLCFDPSVLDELESVAPHLPRVLNVRPERSLAPDLRSALGRLSALSVDIRRLSERYASEVRRAGCPLLAFTCNTTRRLRKALDAGAGGVMTDRPGWLVEQLQAFGAKIAVGR